MERNARPNSFQNFTKTLLYFDIRITQHERTFLTKVVNFWLDIGEEWNVQMILNTVWVKYTRIFKLTLQNTPDLIHKKETKWKSFIHIANPTQVSWNCSKTQLQQYYSFRLLWYFTTWNMDGLVEGLGHKHVHDWYKINTLL